MKRLILVVALAASVAPAQGASEPSFLAVRPNGQLGPLVLYDLDTLRPEVRLSSGLRSADGRNFVSARAAGARTNLTRHALPGGHVAARGSVAGRYRLAAVSARGDRVVLVDQQPGFTRFAVVGTLRWTVFRRVELRGSFGVEALSLDGRRLFLIRYNDGGYNLRLYDLRTGRLSFTPLVEGAAGQRKMIGAAWTSLATRDGRLLLTLYIKPNGGGFVHSLDLDRGFGHCLDLPAGFVESRTIRSASLALSPDERRLYVAGPVAGRLLVVDLAGPRLARIVRFRPADRGNNGDIVGVAAVSPREDVVAFAVDGKVWRYHLAADAVDAPISVGRVAGLGFTPDGRRIVVVRRDAPPKILR